MFSKTLFFFLLTVFITGSASAGVRHLTAVFPTWEPYGYVEDGKTTGFEIEIFKAVADRMQIAVEFIHQPWKRCLYSVKNGRADVVISALKVKERMAYLYYPEEPISQSHTAFFTTVDRPIVFNGSFENLRHYTIGITNGFSYGLAFDNCDFLSTDPSTEARMIVRKVLLARNDLGVGNMAVIKAIAKKEKALSKIKFLMPLLHSQNLYAAFSKARGHQALTLEFSITLSEFKKTADYLRIMKKFSMN